MVYSPNRKGMVLWKIVFRSSNCHSKDKKCSIKDIQYQLKLAMIAGSGQK